MPSRNKTTYLNLNAWEGTDNVQKDDFLSDNIILDRSYKELKDMIEAIVIPEIPEVNLVDTAISITDNRNVFTAVKLDAALYEINDKIVSVSNKVNSISLTASKITYVDNFGLGRNNAQGALDVLASKTSTNTTNISNLTSRVGSLESEVSDTVSALNTANNSLETTIG